MVATALGKAQRVTKSRNRNALLYRTTCFADAEFFGDAEPRHSRVEALKKDTGLANLLTRYVTAAITTAFSFEIRKLN